MQGLQKVLNMAEYNWIMSEWTVLTTAQFWICLVKVSQGFEYAFGSKYATAQNIVSLWTCEGYTVYWLCLNNPK